MGLDRQRVLWVLSVRQPWALSSHEVTSGAALCWGSNWNPWSSFPSLRRAPNSWWPIQHLCAPQQGPGELWDLLQPIHWLWGLKSARHIPDPWLNHILPPASSALYCYLDKATPEEVGHNSPSQHQRSSLLFPIWWGHHEGQIPFLHLTDVFVLRWYLSLPFAGHNDWRGTKNTLVYISKNLYPFHYNLRELKKIQVWVLWFWSDIVQRLSYSINK